MPSKILITGLCLQGNKGGPALLQSIIAHLGRFIPDLEVVVSVPASEIEQERKWQDYFGVGVVPDLSLRAILGPRLLKTAERASIREYFAAVLGVQGCLNMHGIAYVGPPIGTFRQELLGRFRIFLIMKLFGKPFMAWTQSYGPLSTPGIRLLARLDLLSLPMILCRGEDCKAEVLRYFPKADVRSYPDVATTLSYDRDWGKSYLKSHFGLLSDRIITVSPSAVLHNRVGRSSANTHVAQVVDFSRQILDVGYDLILVPHTLRPNQRDPRVCDYTVAEAVADLLKDRDRVFLIKEDLPPDQLKSIIANAYVHIGARYHSLVAALSSGVPAISLSWHPKYRDLMREYGMEDFVVDAVNDPFLDSLSALLTEVIQQRRSLSAMLQGRQNVIASQVEENARIVSEVIRKWL